MTYGPQYGVVFDLKAGNPSPGTKLCEKCDGAGLFFTESEKHFHARDCEGCGGRGWTHGSS